MQAVRALTAPARLRCTARIDSATPVAAFGQRAGPAGQHGIGGGVGVQRVGACLWRGVGAGWAG